MTGESRPAVFLDRDGVLNRAVVIDGKPHPPPSLAELEIPPGTRDALEDLQAAGFILVGVTNQPDVARGKQRREVVEAINAVLVKTLPLQDILVCYHDDRDGCDCRKPRPGLLLQAATKYAIDLPSSFIVGDRWKDIEAGRRAGCKTILMQYGYRETEYGSPPDCRVDLLCDAVDWILSQSGGGSS